MTGKKGFLLLFIYLTTALAVQGQDSIFILKPSMVAENGYLGLPDIDQWKFKEGHDPNWAAPGLDDRGWQHLDSTSIAGLSYGEDGRFEGWFRLRFKFEEGFEEHPYFLVSYNTAAQEIFLDGEKVLTFGSIGNDTVPFRRNVRQYKYLSLDEGRVYTLAVHFVDEAGPLTHMFFDLNVLGRNSFPAFGTARRAASYQKDYQSRKENAEIAFLFSIVLSFLFWLTWLLVRRERHLLFIALLMTLLAIYPFIEWLDLIEFKSNWLNRDWQGFILILNNIGGVGLTTIAPLLIATLILGNIPKWVKVFSLLNIGILAPLFFILLAQGLPFSTLIFIPIASVFISGGISLYLIGRYWRNIKGAKWVIIGAALVIFGVSWILGIAIEYLWRIERVSADVLNLVLGFNTVGRRYLFPLSLLLYVAFWLRETILGERKKAFELVRVTREKDEILRKQNIRLEEEVKNRTAELKSSLDSLKAAQSQLIQSEKMASLGELTAGIAHEIKNPLNFVNNFSEVSRELLEEMKAELKKGDTEEAEAIATDVIQNLEKIVHHGHRADSIVRGMLQHSRSSDGKKEPTDLGALADEYLRLAYHGLRAKDKSFNASMETDFDPDLPEVTIVPQDIGRVLLNLLTNAFHAVNERKQKGEEGYEPTVWVTTQKSKNGVEIRVRDNGGGIPDNIKDKIFQPFFTTKPTGEGTGLGLSMSYDIVTKGHGGKLVVNSKEGKGSEFILILNN